MLVLCRDQLDERLELRDIRREIASGLSRPVPDRSPAASAIPGRPPHRRIQGDPLDDRALHADRSAGLTAFRPVAIQKRVAQMTHHLVRGHRPPATGAPGWIRVLSRDRISSRSRGSRQRLHRRAAARRRPSRNAGKRAVAAGLRFGQQRLKSRASSRSLSNCRLARASRAAKYPLATARRRRPSPALVFADVTQHPAFLKDGFGVVLNLQRAERRDARRPCPRAVDRATRSGSRSRPGMSECAMAAGGMSQRSRASSRRPASPSPITRMPSSAPATTGGSSTPISPSMSPHHHQRPFDAGRHVRIEPARLGVRGERLVVQPAVAAGVNEARKQLGIVAVPAGFAQQAHERTLGLADVGLEVRVELVRDRQARVQLQRTAQGLFRALLAVRARLR